jgi:hypothetical protein
MIYRTVLRTLSVALLGGCFFNASWAADPVEFVVASHGADAGPGSKDRPFATLAQAQKAVREALARDRSRDVTVWIDAGTYELEKPLVFGPEDAPSARGSVTYRARPSGRVVFSGGSRIRNWKAETSGRWVADVPRVKEGRWYPRQLFVNGERRVRARMPSKGFLRGLQTDDALRVVFPPDTLRAWSHPEDIELITLVEWTPSRVRLGTVDVPNQTVRFGSKVFQFFDSGELQHIRKNLSNFPFYFENASEFLDSPGEWFLDRHTGRLSYLPKSGERIDAFDAEMPRLEQLLVVRGTADRPVRGLRFCDLIFQLTGWALPQAGFLPDQCGFFDTDNTRKGLPVPASAIDFQYATGCELQNCRVAGADGIGIRLREGCSSNTVTDCLVEDIGANGVSLGLFDAADSDGDLLAANVVRNCTIRRCGLDYAGCVGIWVGIARDTAIANNEISEIPYTGISCGWSWDRREVGCRNNRIERNHIHHVVRLLADAGGIYTLGDQTGGVIRGNYIHDIKRSSGVAMVNGIFFDNGSRGWRVEDNVIHDVTDGAIRHNDNHPEDQSWGTNYFDMQPNQVSATANIVRQAGPNPAAASPR